MKRIHRLGSSFRAMLVLLVLMTVSGSCNARRDDLQQAAGVIRQHAAKQKAAFRTGPIRFHGTLSAAEGSDGVCACLTVCNADGTGCVSSCSPPKCAP